MKLRNFYFQFLLESFTNEHTFRVTLDERSKKRNKAH